MSSQNPDLILEGLTPEEGCQVLSFASGLAVKGFKRSVTVEEIQEAISKVPENLREKALDYYGAHLMLAADKAIDRMKSEPPSV